MSCISETMVKSQIASAPCSKPATVARSLAQIVRTAGAETSLTSKKTAPLIASDMKQVDVLKDTEFCTDISDDEAATQAGSILSLGSASSESNESDEERCDDGPPGLKPCRLAESVVDAMAPTKLRVGAKSFMPRMPGVKEEWLANFKADDKYNTDFQVFMSACGAYSTPYKKDVKDEDKYNTDYGYPTPAKRVALKRPCAVPPGLQTPLKTSAVLFRPDCATYPLGKPAAFAFASVSAC